MSVDTLQKRLGEIHEIAREIRELPDWPYDQEDQQTATMLQDYAERTLAVHQRFTAYRDTGNTNWAEAESIMTEVDEIIRKTSVTILSVTVKQDAEKEEMRRHSELAQQMSRAKEPFTLVLMRIKNYQW